VPYFLSHYNNQRGTPSFCDEQSSIVGPAFGIKHYYVITKRKIFGAPLMSSTAKEKAN